MYYYYENHLWHIISLSLRLLQKDSSLNIIYPNRDTPGEFYNPETVVIRERKVKVETLKPSPPFNTVTTDLTGPFHIKLKEKKV